MKKKLIEFALPLEAISKNASREKSIRQGHPSTMHQWWSRKPLAACRAVLFASLVDDPSSNPDTFKTEEAQQKERLRLFGLIEELVKWENSNNQRLLQQLRNEIQKSTGGAIPGVLDPFCGGGSIPLEAQRLGLKAYGFDLNPVAVLLTKALIEIPPKFAGQPPINQDSRLRIGNTEGWQGARGLAADVRFYGKLLRDQVFEMLGELYPRVTLPAGPSTTVIAWKWSRAVQCPNPACRAILPTLTSYWLHSKQGSQAWVEPILDRKNRTLAFEVRTGHAQKTKADELSAGTSYVNEKGKRTKASFRCLFCETGVARGEYIDQEFNAGRGTQIPIGIVAETDSGRTYCSFDEKHTRAATELTADLLRDLTEHGFIPDEPAPGTYASNAQGRPYGFKKYSDYFTPRQLTVIGTFIKHLSEIQRRVSEDYISSGNTPDKAREYANAVITYLAFAIDKGVNLWSSLAGWMSDRGAMRETFAQQGISIAWDFAEANPFSTSGGSFLQFVERIADGLEYLPAGQPGEAAQADAVVNTRWPDTVILCTDPPYYDNIRYAILSDFFYVWLRRAVGKIYPDLFSTLLVPKEQELVASKYRFDGSQQRAKEFFQAGLAQAFDRIRRAQNPEYPLTLFYAFKQEETTDDENGTVVTSTGWETLLQAMIDSHLTIEGTWPLRTESAGRAVAQGANTLASSIVLVARPRAESAGVSTRNDFLKALRKHLPTALRTLQQGSVAPVDLAQASIGPGMAIFSSQSQILEADGSKMSIRTALALINQVLDEVLAEQESEFDPDTRWALTWFDQYGFSEGRFGDAETLSKAKDTSVNSMAEAGIIAAQGGKVRLLKKHELSSEWSPDGHRITVWEVAHQLLNRLETDGETGAASLVKQLGTICETARDLAYRLFKISERKKWTEDAVSYNSLAAAWTEIIRLAAERDTTAAQAKLGY